MHNPLDDSLRAYAIDKLEHDKPGDFLKNFLTAALHADPDNWTIMRPAFAQLMAKYPIKHKELLTDQK